MINCLMEKCEPLPVLMDGWKPGTFQKVNDLKVNYGRVFRINN